MISKFSNKNEERAEENFNNTVLNTGMNNENNFSNSTNIIILLSNTSISSMNSVPSISMVE